AEFNNIDQLDRINNTHFTESVNSGTPSFLDVSTVRRAGLQANTIENAAVDLNRELTNMILTQRSYSSISSAFRVTNEIIQSTIQLK
ncbi:MAG: flagellar basal body rod C-terminal domain-containing protein, partial [Pseudomonadota bacterium]